MWVISRESVSVGDEQKNWIKKIYGGGERNKMSMGNLSKSVEILVITKVLSNIFFEKVHLIFGTYHILSISLFKYISVGNNSMLSLTTRILISSQAYVNELSS